MRVWVDLTNSPHVLVMRPVIAGLRARGAEVEVTARDFAQTLELCERHGIDAEVVGRHPGGRGARARLPGADRRRAYAARGVALSPLRERSLCAGPGAPASRARLPDGRASAHGSAARRARPRRSLRRPRARD